MEFLRLGFRRAGHARELFVEAEIVLDGDGGVGLRLLFDFDVFLRLDRLVQAFTPPSAVHYAARVGVDDVHLAVLDDVFDILFIYGVGAQKLAYRVDFFGERNEPVFGLDFRLLPPLRVERRVGVNLHENRG